MAITFVLDHRYMISLSQALVIKTIVYNKIFLVSKNLRTMSAKCGFTSEDGNFEFVSLSSSTLEGALKVMRNSFFLNENVAIACEVSTNEGAKKELEELCVRAANDGVSLIAIDKSTGIIAAASFNKLQIKGNPEDATYFEDFAANCKHDSSKALVQFMIDADGAYNLFDYYKIDCLIEVMFLATLPEYRGKGLGRKLCELSTELGKSLLKGEMVKVSVDENILLKLEPVPKVISAIFTSHITQHIGKQMGWNKLAEISFEKFVYKGQTFASKIGKETPTITLQSMSLLD